jgi:hypothetical protein
MADLSALRQRISAAAETAVAEAVRTTEAEVEQAAPVRSSPSTVGPQTIRARQVAGGPLIGWEIEATTPQALWTEEGRRAFSAAPGKVLRFEVGGEVVFAHSVKAAPARPWFRPTIARVFPQALRQAFSRIR